MYNKEYQREYNKRHYKENPEWYKNYYSENKEKIKNRAIERRNKNRLIVLNHYSGGVAHCACCGETEFDFLTLDHINGGGTKHRTDVNKPGSEFYYWIIKNDFPEGFQILCMNCNFAKGIFGECPHQRSVI
jgi:hypothetical protein